MITIQKYTSAFAATLLGCLTLSSSLSIASSTTVAVTSPTSTVKMDVEHNHNWNIVDFMKLHSTRKNAITVSAILTICYIILKTKSTNYKLDMKNFKTDLNAIGLALKQGKMSLSMSLIKTFINDYIIGREFKALDISYEEVREDGTKIKIKGDSKLKSAPFGLMGLFDAYVIKQIKGIVENYGQMFAAIIAISNFMSLAELHNAKTMPSSK